MSSATTNDTDLLLKRARAGDAEARDALLMRHRHRLKRMFAIWMDRRLTVRVDPSDAVQDTLVLAAQRLEVYLNDPVLPFYAWLRQMAWERLIQLRRRHVYAAKRSVRREAWRARDLPDESAQLLVNRLCASDAAPDRLLHRKEQRQRIRNAIDDLPAHDREILVLFHLEGLSTKEIAAILQISVATAKVRHFRAVRRMKERLKGEKPSDP